MEERILDMSALSQRNYEKVKNGFDKFMNKKCNSYFGYVEKKDLKELNRFFGYLDKRSFIKGSIFGAGVLLAWGLYLVGKESEEKKED